MQTSTPIIDLHVHSTLKPYGNSFYANNNSRVVNSPSCIWFKDRFSVIDSFFENTLGISRYRQSDFTTLVEGQYKMVCVAHYPIEKEFFEIRLNSLDVFEKYIAQFASLLGKDRINYVKSTEYNYFEDLCKEHEFLKQLHTTNPIGGSRIYKIVANSSDIDLSTNLNVLISIEGCHAFCDGTDVRDSKNWSQLKNNVKKVKEWHFRPVFVTFAHHFFNGLCTHAKSLYDASGKLLNQEYGMRNKGFAHKDSEPPITELGREMIRLLLGTDNGKRILIDVKHMSIEARKEYYRILETEFKGQDIPVIWSHGAIDNSGQDINLNLELDVAIIYKTNGIIGIELDQRILGYNHNRFFKWIASIFRSKKKKSFYDAGFFWKQIISIAEYAFDHGYSENPWKCIALGSDYDGVINPLNSYRDGTTVTILYNHLIKHLDDYWKNNNSKIPYHHNGLNSSSVVYQIMYKNAYDFIVKNY